MFRWTSSIFLAAWIVVQLIGQARAPGATEQGATEQGATEQGATEQAATEKGPAEPSGTSYPLDAFTEFSAVMAGSRLEPGEGAQEGHIYRSGRLMRMEDPGRQGYYITDLAAGETYGMSAAGCMHDGHPYIRVFPFSAAKPGATVTRAAAGKETMDGHSCRIETVTVSSPTLASPLKMKLWEADDLQGFPIRIEVLLPGGHNPIIRYKNVVLAPQDPTLFIHPKSCAPISEQ